MSLLQVFFRHDVRAPDAEPARIVGAGTMQLHREGIVFAARKPLPVVPTLVGIAFGFTTLFLLVALFDALGWAEHLNGKGMFLVGMLGGIAPGMLARSAFMSRVRGGRVSALVPWTGIAITHADDDTVEVCLAHETLRGHLAIEPRDDEAKRALAEWFPKTTAQPAPQSR